MNFPKEWAEMLTPWPLRRPLHEVMRTLDGRRWGGTESETLWELVGGHSAAVGPVRRGSLQLQPYFVYASYYNITGWKNLIEVILST